MHLLLEPHFASLAALGGVLPLLGEPLMSQKRGQPLCITGGGFKPPFPYGRVLPWVKGGDLAPKFTLLGEREGLWCPHPAFERDIPLHFSLGIPQRCH